MAGEQFGAMAVNLAGAEADTSAMQIEGLAKAGGQGLGQAVDGYNQADFNRAIEDGEAYLNQMADELNISPENRDMIKFFSGNAESVKAGAKFLMDSTEQQRRDTGINNMLGLGQGINEKYKGLSAGILNKQGMNQEEFKSAQEKLISDKSGEIEGLRVGSKDKYDLAGYDKVFGLGGSDSNEDWDKNYKMEVLKDKKEKTRHSGDRVITGKENLAFRKDLQESNVAIKASQDSGMGGPNGMISMAVDSQALGAEVKNAFIKSKDGEYPGFMPFTTLDALPLAVRNFLSERYGIGDDEYKERAIEFRASVGRYMDKYKKFISGTAVSAEEYNQLLRNMSAGEYNTFSQFLYAFKDMVKKDGERYSRRFEYANKIYQFDGEPIFTKRGVGDPGAELTKLSGELNEIYDQVKNNADIKADMAAFVTERKLTEASKEYQKEQRALAKAENEKKISANDDEIKKSSQQNSFLTITPNQDLDTTIKTPVGSFELTPEEEEEFDEI